MTRSMLGESCGAQTSACNSVVLLAESLPALPIRQPNAEAVLLLAGSLPACVGVPLLLLLPGSLPACVGVPLP